MAKATVKRVSLGKKNAQQIYCMSKSGNVYALKKNVAGNKQHLMNLILKDGVIDTNQWVKVREGEKPQRKAAPKQSNAPRPQMTYAMKDEFGNPVTLVVDNRLPLLTGVWA
jgi:hypothetical protein